MAMGVTVCATPCSAVVSFRARADACGNSHVGLRSSQICLRRLAPAGAAAAFRNGAPSTSYRGRPKQVWRISCCEAEATGRGRDFENQAGRMAEEARRKASDAAKAFSDKAGEVLNDARKKAGEFSDRSDLGGRVNRGAQAAGRKFEEIGYDVRRTASRWDREYRISEKVHEARDFAAEQVQKADRQLGIRQKARNFTSDLRLKLPTYQRQFSNFLETPVGKSFLTLFMLWLLFSGWLFRLLLISMWVLPLAAPLLLGALSKAAVVEGTCPNCGQRYIGGRRQAVTCSRCRGVVWQPRQDFSKDKTNPQIIDIDIEPK